MQIVLRVNIRCMREEKQNVKGRKKGLQGEIKGTKS